MKRLKDPEDLERLREAIVEGRDPKKTCVVIANGTCGQAYGSERVMEAFKLEIQKQGLAERVDIKATGCHGFCAIEPVAVIEPEGILYQKLKPEDVPEICRETLINKNIVERLLYEDTNTGRKCRFEAEIPFYRKQERIISGNNRMIDPLNIDDYIALGGYGALSKALYDMRPEGIIDVIKISGLRGRGGGGFPAGRKWESCRSAKGDVKYVVCNADEGDPGAYMDRSLLEGNPHSIIEGMIIGAYAIGSNHGFVYVRDEYPLAVRNLSVALRQAEDYGLLGENILGSGFDFQIRANRGAGAFVSGESSALMAALEGRVGEPKAKYIHTVERGLWDRPTSLNNVETWANVPLIIERGPDWYSKIGTEKSKGTKIFSLVGKINNTGLVEVPMGITLAEIVYDIGGGIPNGKKLKAVQTGGPSGGCIPESLFDTPVDFERLTEVGSMMGSGGMIVMDEDTCMVDVAKYFLGFLEKESCGKCVPCREGIRQMHHILTDITEGRGQPGDIELLEELSHVLRDASLCALGATAPNPVLTTIRYFREEYESHIKDKRCPAGVCKELIHYSIDQDRCNGCGACLKICPQQAISGQKKEPHTINQDECIKCGACYEACKFDAIVIE
jgi:NADH-quinone oxidoreductase subunit F